MNGQPPYLSNLQFQDVLARFLQRGRNALFSVVFPFACPGCAVLLPYPAALCESCAAALKKIEEPFCLRCGTPFPANWRVKLCELCKTRQSALTRTRSVYFYEGLVREMVRAAKYRGKPRLLRFFGEQMLLIALTLPRVDAIVPVPLHRKRQWQRRFNQARLLSEYVSQLSGIPVLDCLQKKKQTVAQSSLSGVARRKNLKGAFSCIEDVQIPKVVLLIDDVITTGATMEECARTLRRNGARKVYALSIARAVKKF
jgi:ComF family protein